MFLFSNGIGHSTLLDKGERSLLRSLGAFWNALTKHGHCCVGSDDSSHVITDNDCGDHTGVGPENELPVYCNERGGSVSPAVERQADHWHIRSCDESSFLPIVMCRTELGAVLGE